MSFYSIVSAQNNKMFYLQSFSFFGLWRWNHSKIVNTKTSTDEIKWCHMRICLRCHGKNANGYSTLNHGMSMGNGSERETERNASESECGRISIIHTCRRIFDWRLFVLIRVRLFEPFFHFIAHRRHPIVLSPVYMNVNRPSTIYFFLTLSLSCSCTFPERLVFCS